ncbi:GDSL esterase/lipase [Trifolium repens]|nr:GDSL esterase/lipase [Trifolium repens]KAK2403962.1 GDSL esterase/lipase [Trifolium repens]
MSKLLSLLLLLFITIITAEGTKSSYGVYEESNSVKLFVFGDSYADTGNYLSSVSYKPPYGNTFPGKPSGRFSDGRILTDYVASFLKIESPAPYSLRSSSDLKYGMNFAYGGTGVFNTLVDGPNMTTQIDTFEELIQQNVYTKTDLESSVALVSAAGNDYLKFLLENGNNTKDVDVFTASMINQLSINLKRIQSLGISKIAIELMEPMGCLPIVTQLSSYEKCNDTLNMVSMNHNQLLLQAVDKLKMEIGKSIFVTLDLYTAFLSTIESMQKNHDEVAEGTKKSYGVYDESENSVKLFVFGDSYADTGNALNATSYKPPYGITFPGKPAGRFSDGRILTDHW